MAGEMMHLTDELIDAAAEGERLPDDAERHAQECAECGAMIERIRALRGQLAALPSSIDVPPQAWSRVRGRIEQRRARRRSLAGAAAMALAAAVLFAVVRLDSSFVEPTAVAPSAELAELKGTVAPEVIDAMAVNLTVYDAALQELEAFAASQTDDFDVHQRIADLRRKRAALLRVVPSS
jgi:anti-sigma factor RsiW